VLTSTTNTIVYAASRRGAVISDNGKTSQELSPGDFALIPVCTGHQEVNGGDDEVTVREINPFSLNSSTNFITPFSSAPKTVFLFSSYSRRMLLLGL